MDGWIILRTSGTRTLRLVRSLCEDGIEAWSPARKVRIRVPGANVKRDGEAAIVPSFVFARARHLVELLELAAMPDKPRRGPGGRKPAHERFSVFHDRHGIPVVKDHDLEPLREAELDLPAVRLGPAYRRGEKVRVPTGSFRGLVGRVVRSNERITEVCFGANMRVKISTFVLQPNSAHDDETASKAA